MNFLEKLKYKFRKIICRYRGHKFFLTQRLSPTAHQLACENCKDKFFTDPQLGGIILPCDDEMADMWLSYRGWEIVERINQRGFL